MKNFKKILCVALSLLMVVSMFAMNVSAADENDAKINVKYEVEQLASITNNAGDATYTAVDNNIYAVTVYAKAKYGLNYFQVPVHYDETKFAPIMFITEDILADMGYGYDGYYADMGEFAAYDWGYGYAWGSTNMYRTTGATTTTKAQARFIGLGNSNAANVDPLIQYYDSTSPGTVAFHTNLADGVGVISITLDNVGNSKNSYFNAYENAVVTDWCALGTLYFIRLDGVSEADAVGSVFGATITIEEGLYGSQGLWDTSGNPSYFQTTYAEAEPGLNYVSNAVVEEAAEPSPVYFKTSQVRYNSAETNGKGTANFDVRTRAALSVDDFNALCTYDAATKATNIDKVGFVYADSSVGMTLENAAKVIGGTAVAGYVDVPVEHIQKTATEYVWTCLLEDAAYADAVDSVGYIVVDGETYYFDAVYATDFSDLYDAQSSHIPTA